ncbi:MAG: hypothetical protein GC185_06490 [Alphaproteobacteria bacterium]|nr:hypothetical protein [Alphaproteobacteria bacterium]
MTHYAAYVIGDAAREKLLEAFPPKYPRAVAHHITHRYDCGADELPPPSEKVEVVGFHDSGAMQVLVVEVDGRKHQAPRADDDARRFYHITLSLDPAQGVSPSKSNDVLEKIAAEKGEAALRNLEHPMAISVTPAVLADDPKPKSPPFKPK